MESMTGSAQSKGEFRNALSMLLSCYQLISVGCGVGHVCQATRPFRDKLV